MKRISLRPQIPERRSIICPTVNSTYIHMSSINRRNFLKASGVAVLPSLIPVVQALAADVPEKQGAPAGANY